MIIIGGPTTPADLYPRRRTMMLGLASALFALGCNAPLKACPKGQTRGWCQVDITSKTIADLNADRDGVVKRTTVTACVSEIMGMPAIGLIDKVGGWIRANYTQQDGLIEYVVKGDWGDPCTLLVSARIARDANGYTLCNTVAGESNPYGGDYVNLDANAIEPTIHTQGIGGAGPDTPKDSCSECLAGACPDMADLAACAHDHCGAVCPLDSGATCESSTGTGYMSDCVGVGSDCSAAVCCVGLSCYASDVGATCM